MTAKRKPKRKVGPLSTAHLLRCFRAWKQALGPYRVMPDYARQYYAKEIARRLGIAEAKRRGL